MAKVTALKKCWRVGLEFMMHYKQAWAGGSLSRSLSTGAEVKSLKCSSDSLASLDSTRWMRACQNRAKALERKRKASHCLEEFDRAALLARGMSPSEIEIMSTRTCDAIQKTVGIRYGKIDADLPPSTLRFSTRLSKGNKIGILLIDIDRGASVWGAHVHV